MTDKKKTPATKPEQWPAPKKEDDEDPGLGGDSEEFDSATEVHRPEQDGTVLNEETGLPSPSTR